MTEVPGLRRYLRAQNPGRHTIDHLEERGVEKESAQQFSLKAPERTVSNATLGKLIRDGVECIISFSKLQDTIFN